MFRHDEIAPPVVQLGVVGNIEQLELGRSIYINQCTKCHNALRVTRYSKFEWDYEIFPGMIEEASLNAKESNAVTAYVHEVLKKNPELLSSAIQSTR